MRNVVWTGLAVLVAALAHSASAHAAASNLHVTRGAGNELVLTWTESTVTYGLQWWLDGSAYAVTARAPGDCTQLSDRQGMICTFLAPVSSVRMTTDKYVSPNTQTHVEIDSQGAADQRFDVLVEGGESPGPTPTATPSPTPTPVATPDPRKVKEKEDAVERLKISLGEAIADCSVALGGGALVGAGAVGGGVNIGAGLPATVAGTLMVSLASPLCANALNKIKRDVDIANDPPDANFAQVALPAKTGKGKPASCRKAPKRGKATCGRLTKAGAALAAAGARTEAVRAAMSITMNRVSGAEAAGDANGLTLQHASFAVLSGMLAKATRDENKAAAAFAKVARRAKLRARLNAKQAKQGIDRTLKRLAAQGVPTPLLQQLVGTLPAAKPIDVLKTLAKPTPTADLTATARALGAADATAYLTVAAAQLKLTPAAARTKLTAAGAILPTG